MQEKRKQKQEENWLTEHMKELVTWSKLARFIERSRETAMLTEITAVLVHITIFGNKMSHSFSFGKTIDY